MDIQYQLWTNPEEKGLCRAQRSVSQYPCKRASSGLELQDGHVDEAYVSETTRTTGNICRGVLFAAECAFYLGFARSSEK